MRAPCEFTERLLHRRCRQRTRKLWIWQQHDWTMLFLCRRRSQFDRYVLLQFRRSRQMCRCCTANNYSFHDLHHNHGHLNPGRFVLRIVRSFTASRVVKRRNRRYCHRIRSGRSTSCRPSSTPLSLSAQEEREPKRQRPQPSITSKDGNYDPDADSPNTKRCAARI